MAPKEGRARAGGGRSDTMRRALLLLLAAAGSSAAREPGSAQCRELGFTDALACSQCDTLASFVKDAPLTGECRSCCTQEADESRVKWHRGVLEVCN